MQISSVNQQQVEDEAETLEQVNKLTDAKNQRDNSFMGGFSKVWDISGGFGSILMAIILLQANSRRRRG